MLINADFSVPVLVSYASGAWQPSPMAGVERLMLDRIGGEKARATSIVRYAPESRFSEHRHDEGEEFLVLEGVFSDASGSFPSGAYVRNPPGSAHAPWSEPGCTIFVKLRQFDPHDLSRVVVQTDRVAWNRTTDIPCLKLHEYGSERIDLLDLADNARLATDAADGGAEFLVLTGSVQVNGQRLGPWSWVRLPPGSDTELLALEPSRLYRKRGHLQSAAKTE